jgi:hypothetical protein
VFQRVFRLTWEPAAQGYRRTFPPGRWTWDDGRVWTGGEVRVMLGAGLGGGCEGAPDPRGVTRRKRPVDA